MIELPDELLQLLDAHDGDDRCGCLRATIIDIAAEQADAALTRMRHCLAEHPAGHTWRRSLMTDLDSTD